MEIDDESEHTEYLIPHETNLPFRKMVGVHTKPIPDPNYVEIIDSRMLINKRELWKLPSTCRRNHNNS